MFQNCFELKFFFLYLTKTFVFDSTFWFQTLLYVPVQTYFKTKSNFKHFNLSTFVTFNNFEFSSKKNFFHIKVPLDDRRQGLALISTCSRHLQKLNPVILSR